MPEPTTLPDFVRAYPEAHLPFPGAVCLRMAGEESTHGPGDVFFIPTGVPHSARIPAGYRAIIVFDEPNRYGAK